MIVVLGEYQPTYRTPSWIKVCDRTQLVYHGVVRERFQVLLEHAIVVGFLGGFYVYVTIAFGVLEPENDW